MRWRRERAAARAAVPGPRAVRRGGLFRRFRRDQDGVTAVEFGMVALPFFALLLAIFETALVMWAGQVLDTLVSDAARRIYTGQFQNANSAQNDSVELAKKFKEEVCTVPNPDPGPSKPARVPRMTLFDCEGLLQVDIRLAPAFGTMAPNMVDSSTKDFNPASFGYQKVGPDQIALVRAAIAWPLHMSIAMGAQYSLSGNRKLLVATAAFKTEPYQPK